MLHGKEVFNFFTLYNISGIIAILVFCVLLFFVNFKILNLRLIYQLDSYSDFLQLFKNKYSFFNNKFFLFIINIFLMVTFYIMLVGLITLFHYQFGIQKIIINFIIILFCYYIFNKNNLHFLYALNT